MKNFSISFNEAGWMIVKSEESSSAVVIAPHEIGAFVNDLAQSSGFSPEVMLSMKNAVINWEQEQHWQRRV